jgi:hypothetical protein
MRRSLAADPVASHDAIAQAELLPHVRNNSSKLLVICASVLALHPDLEHFDLEMS